MQPVTRPHADAVGVQRVQRVRQFRKAAFDVGQRQCRKDAEAAASDLGAARLNAINAKRSRELSTLRSPIDGVVTKLNAVLGANVMFYSVQDEHTIIIAADTLVILNEKVIGKPADKNEAVKTLSALSGQKHLVVTVVVIVKGEKEVSFTDITEVWFHELTYEQIEYYVEKYNPFDKAGAYAIQEWIGVIGIKRINGDFYNVMGLPISRVVKELSNFAK